MSYQQHVTTLMNKHKFIPTFVKIFRWSFQDRSSHITCFVIIPLFYTFQQSYYRNESLIISVTLMRMCALLIVEMESLKHDLYFNVHAAL